MHDHVSLVCAYWVVDNYSETDGVINNTRASALQQSSRSGIELYGYMKWNGA